MGGVACYLSHAKTGGYSGALGLAEDTSDAAVACRQVGPITFKDKIDKQDEVFNARSVSYTHLDVYKRQGQDMQTCRYSKPPIA